ncbi:MAG: hypothetical protein BJ554DRAFT_2810 [Olpidium bornovanus]|uniref:C2H2-type domain-containing protein n=1 Tax=Olpidium bornovanus TaxID=278681 RepID=A0A8H7ZPU2_9FUNG|nr:MAG: hypothetical protein BJ554DRAFT_2810 [Olpidium bornovanus]
MAGALPPCLPSAAGRRRKSPLGAAARFPLDCAAGPGPGDGRPKRRRPHDDDDAGAGDRFRDRCRIPLPAKKRKLPLGMARLIAEAGLVIHPALHPPVIHPAPYNAAPPPPPPPPLSERSRAPALPSPVTCRAAAAVADLPWTRPAVGAARPAAGASAAPRSAGAPLDADATPPGTPPLRVVVGAPLPTKAAAPLSHAARAPGPLEPSPPGGAGACASSSPDGGAASALSLPPGTDAVAAASGGPCASPLSVDAPRWPLPSSPWAWKEGEESSNSSAPPAERPVAGDAAAPWHGPKEESSQSAGRPVAGGTAEAQERPACLPAERPSVPSWPPRSSLPGSTARLHKCSSCPAAFARGHDLRRHQNTHTSVRDHGCTICGRRFSRRDALRRHMGVCGVQKKMGGPGTRKRSAAKKAVLYARNDGVSYSGTKRTKIAK